MSKCIHCWKESYGRKVCNSCLGKFVNRRTRAFKQAEKELGKLNAINHKAITKRLKQLEKQMEKE